MHQDDSEGNGVKALRAAFLNSLRTGIRLFEGAPRRWFHRPSQIEDARLRETLARYRALVDDINEVYIVIRGEHIVFANQRCAELLGKPVEELLGRSFWEYVAPESVEFTKQIYEATMTREAVPETWETTIMNEAGEKTPVEIRFKRIIYESKPAYALLIRDVSARKKAEEEIIQRSKRLEVISELTRIIGSSLDIRDIYQAFTSEIKKIIDFDRASIALVDGDKLRFFAVSGEVETGLGEGDIIPLAGSTTAWVMEHKRSNIETDFTQEAQFSIDERQLLKSGLKSAIRVPLFSRGEVFGTFNLTSRHPNAYGEMEREILEQLAGQIAAAVENSLLFIQISERENELSKAYAELKAAHNLMVQSESLRALGEMASGVAHDFNNMLSVILGRAQLALGITKDPRMVRDLRIIEQSALDGAKTVRRLQDFARVRVDREFEVLDLNEVVRDALQMVEPRRLERQAIDRIAIDISAEIGKAIPIEGDSAELREVLTNIVFNAMDAMPQGGKITIKSWLENNWVVLSITDTGLGIPEEIKGRLFDPFFTTKSTGGLGMGLSVAYGIISRHGGSINVDSSAGKGATFYIKLPVAVSTGKRLLLPEEPTSIKRATILLIEDDPQTNEVLRLMLERLGHQVEGFTNAKEALETFDKDKSDYDIVVTDMGMQEMSGRDVARRIKEMKPETSVIVITGWGTQLDPGELRKVGIDGVVSKPFTKEALSAKLTELLPTSAGSKAQ